MDAHRASGPRILAGAPSLDRRVFPRPGSVSRWFEPFHVRQPAVARGELAAQVAAGADIVVAPAWLTHRRALETVGESRRAREWTNAAVRLARDAVEAGLERREGEATGPVLVAGPLPDVAARPETGSGRLLPGSASAERDSHDQAGILADSEVDLVLVEPRPTFEASLRATETVVDVGRPVWTVISPSAGEGEPPLHERLAMLAAAGAAGVLIEPLRTTDGPRTTELLAADAGDPDSPSLGLVAETPPLATTDADLDAWLRAGAQVLGLASGASPGELRPLAEARDRLVASERERAGAVRTSLAGWVAAAAERAPGGRALWLGPVGVERPPGFDWTDVDPVHASLAGLPAGTFRLVVCLVEGEPGQLGRLAERGGIVAIQLAGGVDADLLGRLGSAGLRVLEVATAPDGGTRLMCRREHD